MRTYTARTVDLFAPIELLERNLTRALFEGVWRRERTTERERAWTLEFMVGFWTAVTLDPPASLSQALAEATGEPDARYPAPRAHPKAFFARSQDMKWEFFREVFDDFRRSVQPELRPAFAAELAPIRDRFTALEAWDGSTLDAVARRVKALWKERATVLPGAIEAFYDLSTGTISRLIFDPDLERAEFERASDALESIPEGTLLVGDRLYGVPKMFAALTEHGLFGLARQHGAVGARREELLSRTQNGKDVVEDWIVEAGCGQTAPPQKLRLIRVLRGTKVKLQLLTNVLEPEKLSAQEALTLYRHRWTVERLFSDLKEVLKLERFYAANVNAIGMQVYAAAIVHTALRAGQALVAEQAGIAPERISTKKFFPHLAAAACARTGARMGFEMTQRANPRTRLIEPDWRLLPCMRLRLEDVLVEKRTGKRSKRKIPKRAWRTLLSATHHRERRAK